MRTRREHKATSIEWTVNLVARFESFIERLMERGFTRATRSQLQPVEIGKRLVRAMESEQSVGMEGVLVPNVYDVFLNPIDFQHFEPMRRSLAQNLEAHLGRTARQRRYRMVSRPIVRLHRSQGVLVGTVRVEPHLQDVDTGAQEFQHTAVLPAVDDEVSPRRATPNLVVASQSYAVLRSPTRLGRLPDNDIVLNDKRVSRHHAEVMQQGGRWVLRDTGSTNGIAVNGKIVREAVLKPGDVISLGGLEGVWEQ
jgi:hypothetical protein